MFSDANELGLSPENPPSRNVEILQAALDRGGTVVISEPGIYQINTTLFIKSDTTLDCANGVSFKKIASPEPFAQVIMNRGALTREFDEHIVIRGLKILVNEIYGKTQFPGMRGQLGFFCVRDLRLEDIRIPDLEPTSYGIHVCTFEDLSITGCKISGKKDGIHLGRGRRFYIGNCVFDTYDDAVALNGHDYDTGNPQLGFIEDGMVELCYDINPDKAVGYFSRILAGAWVDWYEGIEVQKSDTVVSNGRLYRVFAQPDGRTYISRTRPTHEVGHAILDGIDWVMVQDDATYSAGVRNVTFRDIFLYKPRTSFSVHFDRDRYSRSFYPGAAHPLQEALVFENICVLHDGGQDFISVGTPIDSMRISGCSLRGNGIVFRDVASLGDLGKTRLTLTDCTTTSGEISSLIKCEIPSKELEIKVDGVRLK